MKLQRIHPFAAITALCLVAATSANLFTLDWSGHAFSYTIGSLLLASPFAVLLAGHMTVAKTWRRNVFLSMGSLLFVVAWSIASFAMRWFQPGWPGAVFFGVVLAVLAAGYLLLSLAIREPA